MTGVDDPSQGRLSSTGHGSSSTACPKARMEAIGMTTGAAASRLGRTRPSPKMFTDVDPADLPR